MSGKQSAKPRFGGVFFCPQKSIQLIEAEGMQQVFRVGYEMNSY